MAETKRTPYQIAEQRVEIARRYLHGEFQHKIAADLGLSQGQISYDLRAIREQWLQASITDFDKKKAEEIAKIDDLEITYREAWERSLKPKKSKKLKAKGQSAESLTGVEREEKEEQRDGNPSYLQGVQWCINKRCEIFGFNAPIKQHHTGSIALIPPDKLPEVPDEELNEYISLLERQLQH